MLVESFNGSGVWPISHDGNGDQYTPPHMPLAVGVKCRAMMNMVQKMGNLGSQKITSTTQCNLHRELE